MRHANLNAYIDKCLKNMQVDSGGNHKVVFLNYHYCM